MSRLDAALRSLAERGNPIGPEMLIAGLDRQLASEPVREIATLETRRRTMDITPTTTRQPPPSRQRPRMALAVAAAVVVVGIATFAIASFMNSGTDAAADDPASTIRAYIDAYNAGDIDAVMALFSDDSVIVGHPFASEQSGLAAIRNIQSMDISAAATENAYTISNVQVTGNTVTWDHIWFNRDGDRFCLDGHSAIVEDGTILSWTWPSGSFECR